MAGDKEESGGVSMTFIYSILVVLIIIVIFWSCMGDEKFLPKQTKSDRSGDWDLLSALAKLDKKQEDILAQSLANRRGVMNLM
jgi:hypothetical protein